MNGNQPIESKKMTDSLNNWLNSVENDKTSITLKDVEDIINVYLTNRDERYFNTVYVRLYSLHNKINAGIEYYAKNKKLRDGFLSDVNEFYYTYKMLDDFCEAMDMCHKYHQKLESLSKSVNESMKDFYKNRFGNNAKR